MLPTSAVKRNACPYILRAAAVNHGLMTCPVSTIVVMPWARITCTGSMASRLRTRPSTVAQNSWNDVHWKGYYKIESWIIVPPTGKILANCINLRFPTSERIFQFAVAQCNAILKNGHPKLAVAGGSNATVCKQHFLNRAVCWFPENACYCISFCLADLLEWGTLSMGQVVQGHHHQILARGSSATFFDGKIGNFSASLHKISKTSLKNNNFSSNETIGINRHFSRKERIFNSFF